MKRPILNASIGFIIGIIWGLYFNIASFLLLVVITYLFLYIIKFKKIKNIRIIRLFLTRKVIILFTIFSLISFFYIQYLEKDYDKIYNSLEKVKCVGTIISEKEEKDYSYQYKIKLEKINNKTITNKKFYISIKKNKKNNPKYAEKIYFEGEYIKPEIKRNYKGFDNSLYLKSKGIYGTIKIDNDIEVIKEKNLSLISIMSNKIRNKIIQTASKLFTDKTKGVFLGILIGDDKFLTEDVKDNFSSSSLSHLLAVSGMHVSYVLLGITIFLKLFKVSKSKSKILSCLLLIFYLYIINFTPSVTRAVIMSIIAIMQVVLHRKTDIATTISFSCLLVLISNPYKILNLGFVLSYLGTIGIIIFSKEFQKNNLKIIIILKNMCFVAISAFILIFPVTLYCFNTFSLTFIIPNLIAGLLIGPITIIGLIIIIISFINIKIAYFIVKIYNILLLVLIKSTEITSKISISKIYVKTPNIISLIIYYLIILFIIIIFKIKQSNRIYLNNKLNFIITKYKNKIKNNIFNIIIFILIISITIFFYKKIPKNLKINFVDVGQGDCTLITTPNNKKIIVDGGGNENYDIGKNTLLPYLLDRGITKIDYIIVSHFDTDHCKGLYYVMKNIKVKNIIVSKQPEQSVNYKEFLNIAKKKRIKVIYMNKGDRISIEKNIDICFLWPDSSNLVTENPLNNNSIVCKLVYKNFSCIFTGDIEKIAEEKILKQYEKKSVLKSTILKVAHHGSKTSSTEEIIKKIKPKIALIGVGQNNKFGHPNDEVIERLKACRYNNI